jgi:ISXO2 transposase-like protein
MKRINHQEAYSLEGACTNMAEEYFSRLRRAEIGIHHHIAGAYLLRYAAGVIMAGGITAASRMGVR